MRRWDNSLNFNQIDCVSATLHPRNVYLRGRRRPKDHDPDGGGSGSAPPGTSSTSRTPKLHDFFANDKKPTTPVSDGDRSGWGEDLRLSRSSIDFKSDVLPQANVPFFELIVRY